MRTLPFNTRLPFLREIKSQIVPILFTEHQFSLIEKRLTNKKMTPSEKNEFSRTVSRKMRAINSILEVENEGIFVYGREKIRRDRLKPALSFLKTFSRKFKNRHVLISGSFLCNKKYNDIDLFVVSKYEKEDIWLGKFHINYLAEDAYYSLFFASLKKLCVSNQKIADYKIREKIGLDSFISLYQELFNEVDRKFRGINKTMREFLLQAAFVSQSPLPDSADLAKQVRFVFKAKKQKEIIKKIFAHAVVLASKPKIAIKAMEEVISSYQDIIKEYKQHKAYYYDLIQAFQEVIAVES